MKTKEEEAAVVREDLINNSSIVNVAVVEEEVSKASISHFNQIINFKKKTF